MGGAGDGPASRTLRHAEHAPGGLGVGLTYEQLQGVNNIIVGNPETVTRKLAEVIEHLQPGYLHIYGNEGRWPIRM